MAAAEDLEARAAAAGDQEAGAAWATSAWDTEEGPEGQAVVGRVRVEEDRQGAAEAGVEAATEKM